jgi:hypothetical protein
MQKQAYTTASYCELGQNDAKTADVNQQPHHTLVLTDKNNTMMQQKMLADVTGLRKELEAVIQQVRNVEQEVIFEQTREAHNQLQYALESGNHSVASQALVQLIGECTRKASGSLAARLRFTYTRTPKRQPCVGSTDTIRRTRGLSP